MLVFLDVLFREVIGLPLLWTSDITLGLFIWSVFLGAAIGFRKRLHFTVELIAFEDPGRQKILDLIACGLTFIFIILVFIYGISFAISGYKQYSMMLGFRRVYIYAAIPCSMLLMIVFAIEQFASTLANRASADNAESIEQDTA